MSTKSTAGPDPAFAGISTHLVRSVTVDVDPPGNYIIVTLTDENGQPAQFMLPYASLGWLQHQIEGARHLATLFHRNHDRGAAAMEAMIAAALRPNVQATYMRADPTTGDTVCVFQFPQQGAMSLRVAQSEVHGLIDLQARTHRISLT